MTFSATALILLHLFFGILSACKEKTIRRDRNLGASVAALILSKSELTLALDESSELSVSITNKDDDTSSLDGLDIEWSGCPDTIATVAGAAGKAVVHAKGVGSCTLTAALTGYASASADVTVTEQQSNSTPTPSTSARLTGIVVLNGNLPNYMGVTQTMQALGIYDDGTVADISSSVDWSSSSPSVTTINNTSDKGASSHLTSGSSTIEAVLNGVSGSRAITVNAATLTSIAIIPANASLATGYQIPLEAVGTYSDGTEINLTSAVTWASSATAKATMSNTSPTKGVLTAVSSGSTIVTATLLSVTGSATVSVSSATLASISTSPASVTMASGTEARLYAEGVFSDNSVLDLSRFAAWSSNNAGVTVSNTAPYAGLVTANATSSATITATANAASDTASVTVSAATIDSIAITPSAETIDLTDQLQFKAIATFSDASTQDVTNVATWTSTSTSNVVISNASPKKGLSAAVAAGSSMIRATLGGVVGTTTLTVTAGVPGITTGTQLTPSSSHLSESSTQQFVATALKSDGSTQVVSGSATWNSSDTGVATVSGSGLVTAVSAGTTLITATSDGFSTTARVTVTVDQANPGVPTGLAGVASSGSDITYSWTANGATTAFYRYAYKLGAAAPASCTSDTYGTTTASSIALTGLVDNTQYTLIVCACNSNTVPDCSAATAGVSATTFDEVSAPAFSPVAGDYADDQAVTISTSTGGATIHYTTDGSTPTASSTQYAAPITVNNPLTLKAIAVKSGYVNSSVSSAAYTFTAATPTFSVAAGTYTSNQNVTLLTATTFGTIHYTVDDSTPTASSPTFTGPISVNSSQTIKALTVHSGWTSSAVASAAYVISGSIAYSATSFAEAAANDGSVTATVVLTLSNDTFAAGPFNAGDEYSISSGAVPAGLTLAVARDSTTQLTLSLSGNATAHANANDTTFTIAFNTAAFTRGVIPSAGAGGSKSISVDFADPAASCLYGGVSVGGSCWYNANGAMLSCASKCAMLTLSYDVATENYAGTGGSAAQCNAVVEAILGTATALPVHSWNCSVNSTAGIGCILHSVADQAIWCNDGTNSTAEPTAPGDFRMCACF